MNWITKTASFRYQGKPVTRTTIKAKTSIMSFTVYESVGGNSFYKNSSMVNHNDPYNEILSGPKIRCKNIEEGKQICESYWQELKEAINRD